MKETAMPFAALAFLPRIVRIAREHGYALTVHGSLARDYDFVAIPWTEEATSAEDLVEAVRANVGGFIVSSEGQTFPAHKPHGRLAWSIHLGAGPYIDLSVMPRVARGEATGAATETGAGGEGEKKA